MMALHSPIIEHFHITGFIQLLLSGLKTLVFGGWEYRYMSIYSQAFKPGC